MIPIPGVTEVKVTNLEFSYKSKIKLRLSLYSHIIRPFDKFHYRLTERLSGYSYQQGICSVEALFVHTLFLSYGQSFYFKVYKTLYYEDPLMDFIHIWPDGRYRKFLSAPTLPWRITLGSRSQT